MNCPLPRYYLCHAVIALLIAAALWWPLGLNAGLAAGVAFYAGYWFNNNLLCNHNFSPISARPDYRLLIQGCGPAQVH
jgi:hypothetical protein